MRTLNKLNKRYAILYKLNKFIKCKYLSNQLDKLLDTIVVFERYEDYT